MQSLYKNIEHRVEEHNNPQWFFEARLNYFVSDVMDMMGIDDTDEIALSLYRTFQACGTLQLPMQRNFQRIYRYDGKTMIADWKMSALACYLVIINCNPLHENVAKAQLHFAVRKDNRQQ